MSRQCPRRHSAPAVPDNTRVGRRGNFRQLRSQCTDSNSKKNRWLRFDSRCASSQRTRPFAQQCFQEPSQLVRPLPSQLPLTTVVADQPKSLPAARSRKTQDPFDQFAPETRLDARTFYPGSEDRRRETLPNPNGRPGYRKPDQSCRPTIARTFPVCRTSEGTGKPSRQWRSVRW